MDAPGTENPLSHSLLGLEEFPFPKASEYLATVPFPIIGRMGDTSDTKSNSRFYIFMVKNLEN